MKIWIASLALGPIVLALTFSAWLGLAKGHGPKHFPLTCFDCHFPHPLVEEPKCFDCHGTGEAPALDCFDCHGRHNQERAPDLSNVKNCFRCHGSVAMDRRAE